MRWGIGRGSREARKGEKEKIIDVGLSFPIQPLFLIYGFRAVGAEWQIRQDDLESESVSRWQIRNSSLSSQELDRLMRVKITSLDFGYKNDFPYL